VGKGYLARSAAADRLLPHHVDEHLDGVEIHVFLSNMKGKDTITRFHFHFWKLQSGVHPLDTQRRL